MVAALALFIINFIFKKVMLIPIFIKELVQDIPEVLFHKGKTEFKTIERSEITDDELTEAMREYDVEFYKDVKLAMFEIDGSISIISRDNR